MARIMVHRVIVVALLTFLSARGQERAPASTTDVKLPAWDVISVRQSDPNHCTGSSGLRETRDGLQISCVSMLFVIRYSYGRLESNRILNAPDWVKGGVQWSIDAKVAGDDVAAYSKLGSDDKNRMLQSLLTDRFHLKAHMEKRDMPIYALVVAKGGPKLKVATADEDANAQMLMTEPGKLEAISALVSELPSSLTREVGRPIVDRTGLTGKYDLKLDFVPRGKAATDETGGPSVFTAVEEQLGLKLEPAKQPMDVVVIESIEQPLAN